KIKKIIWDEKLTYRESLLIPRGDGFIIKLNPKKSQVRLRFSCAHEIGHTYFFDLNTRPPQKFYSTSSSRYWVEEGYASEIAGEILLPEPYLSKTASKISKDPSLEALTQLRNDFNVSYEVLIKRLFRDSHLWNSNFWGNNLWDGIVITAEIKKTGTPQMKVYRSPKYRYKLKNITNNEKIKEVIHCALENGIAKDDVIKIRKNRYRIQCRVSRKWPKMTILIIYGET
ncbi:MAG TPA: ImmA/IrrE family metallo-endopeptidase, partial [Thermoplasmatales archaeon]|nr:ImmA/IrrE family metallo-endopeptidase [Thermoplasmatales archaeon]